VIAPALSAVYFFLALKASGAGSLLALDSSLTSELVLYIVASFVANGLATPLEVVRTRLLLQRTADTNGARPRYSGILDALVTINREEGVEALFRGLPVRLLWNGLWLGLILFLQRTAYIDVQTYFLGVVEAVEEIVGSEWEQWLRFLTTFDVPSNTQLDPSMGSLQDQLMEQWASFVQGAEDEQR
jgi:hypothetical protein